MLLKGLEGGFKTNETRHGLSSVLTIEPVEFLGDLALDIFLSSVRLGLNLHLWHDDTVSSLELRYDYVAPVNYRAASLYLG